MKEAEMLHKLAAVSRKEVYGNATHVRKVLSVRASAGRTSDRGGIRYSSSHKCNNMLCVSRS